MTSTISREELKSKIDRKDDFTLLEVLSSEAYQLAHLPGAINLPLSELASRTSEVLPDKSAEIVVYCASPT